MKKRYLMLLMCGVIGVSSTMAYALGQNDVIGKIANFKVLVGGDELKSKNPIVTIGGTTYLSLKDIGEALGIKVNWNNTKKQVEVGESKHLTTDIPTQDLNEHGVENPTNKTKKVFFKTREGKLYEINGSFLFDSRNVIYTVVNEGFDYWVTDLIALDNNEFKINEVSLPGGVSGYISPSAKGVYKESEVIYINPDQIDSESQEISKFTNPNNNKIIKYDPRPRIGKEAKDYLLETFKLDNIIKELGLNLTYEFDTERDIVILYQK